MDTFRNQRVPRMKKLFLYSIAALLLASVGVAVWVIRGLSDFDLSSHNIKQVSFSFEGAVLSGTLAMPHSVQRPPIAILIHGDGPQDRFSNGGYLPMINTLLDAGIGVFSWDKPGVGTSSGNWLHQTMDDRANEALAALRAVSARDDVNAGRVGFLGFSQAGWVLPRVVHRTTPAFTVLVGGAVSWREQGTYYSRVEMTLAGIDDRLVEQHLQERRRKNDALFDRSADPFLDPDMDPERARFVAGAYWEDATDMIHAMKGPVLAIWGADDLNVDARSDSDIYKQQLMPLSEHRRVVVVPNATHGLLRADVFNYQLTSQWPWYLSLAFVGMGRDAYAEQALDQITSWILAAAPPDG